MLVHFVSDDSAVLPIAEEAMIDIAPIVGDLVKFHGSMFTVTSRMLVVQNDTQPFYRIALMDIV